MNANTNHQKQLQTRKISKKKYANYFPFSGFPESSSFWVASCTLDLTVLKKMELPRKPKLSKTVDINILWISLFIIGVRLTILFTPEPISCVLFFGALQFGPPSGIARRFSDIPNPSPTRHSSKRLLSDTFSGRVWPGPELMDGSNTEKDIPPLRFTPVCVASRCIFGGAKRGLRREINQKRTY